MLLHFSHLYEEYRISSSSFRLPGSNKHSRLTWTSREFSLSHLPCLDGTSKRACSRLVWSIWVRPQISILGRHRDRFSYHRSPVELMRSLYLWLWLAHTLERRFVVRVGYDAIHRPCWWKTPSASSCMEGVTDGRELPTSPCLKVKFCGITSWDLWLLMTTELYLLIRFK